MRPALLLLLPVLAVAGCAPLPMRAAPAAKPPAITATQLTTSARYTTPPTTTADDSPVLATVVSLAPAAPHNEDRQPWRAEEIARSSVALRSRATIVDNTTFETTVRSMPFEMSFNTVSSGGVTTLTATYSSAYAATAQYIFDNLDKRFKRLP